MKSVVFKALLLVLASHTTVYANEALQRCRAITEASARLVCYDALPLGTVASKPTAPAAVNMPSSNSEAAAWAKAQAQAQAQGVPLFVKETSTQFGMDKEAAVAKLDAIESSIEGRFEGWNANEKIALANGQTWQVVDGSRATLFMQNPKVKVRRGMLGAYYLDIDGTNKSPRVRRVK